ncbi:predicted protein [Naegleria gruberi]|uniref:peptidylprolyl isomerase n=1 Tax=Naegleria gruberi TaxID=5762 RepID=D2VL58_NAEGR|nr:uncharacterized protein NAEGRDRAFT_58571 [Naegleria gruberi]EFC42560.1 predicted protein [Naegleria gruberi]|eukprot:XP_002675304.1 predicted protein [Naegleria gruberi strain NEG-M]
MSQDIDRVFFEVEVKGNSLGRIVVELFRDKCPNICNNIITLCKGPVGYKGSKVFRVIKKMMIQAGDYEFNTGEGGKQVVDGDFANDYYDSERDEDFLMFIDKKSTKEASSQFLFSTTNLSYMKNELLPVGKITKGTSILSRIERIPVVETTGYPSIEITFMDCGVLEHGQSDGILDQQNVEEGDIYPQYPADNEDVSLGKKMEIAEQLKELGNQFFKQGNLSKALEKYEKAFRYLAPGMREENERKLLEEKEIVILGNIAAVKIKQSEYATVIELCNKVLQLVTHHNEMEGISAIETKAKFRRGVSYFSRGDWQNSERDFSDLLENNLGNKEIEVWHKKAKAELEKYKEKEKHTFSKLFK